MQYEYKIVAHRVNSEIKEDIPSAESMLNTLSSNGWEVVSSHTQGASAIIQFVLRREV